MAYSTNVVVGLGCDWGEALARWLRACTQIMSPNGDVWSSTERT